MNTARPSSRNQQSANGTGITSTAAPPRRAKVASAAQMDISLAYPSKPLSVVGSSTTNPLVRPTIASSASFSNNSSSSNNSNNNSSNNYGYPAANSNNNASGGYNTPPRIGTVRVRSSNSVVTTASFRNTGSPSSAVGAGPGRRDTGSVTSDDGTVSEDSDRAADDGQLFSGGHSISGSSNVGVSVPFGTMGRQTSATGSIYSTAGPKIATGGRQRTASSTVGVSNIGNSSTVGSTTTSTTPARPMRMAAGASMSSSQSYLGVSSAPGSNAGSVVGASSLNLTSSASSHHGVGNNSSSTSRMGPTVSTRNGDDTGSVISMSSAISTSTSIQQQPVTIRSAKSVSASKQAEETRRAEEAAKRTRRKVEDLEISNASLLQINKTLEATIRKQAAEMAELKLRASSAHYGDLGYSAADLALAQSVEAIELTEMERQDDLMFKRMCLTIEQMIYEAKHALDQSTKPTGVKVLSLYDMYEKEVTEDAEEGEDDDTEEGNRSFMENKDQDEAGISIEVLQLEDDDGDDDAANPLTKGQQRPNQDLSHGPIGDETDQDRGKNSLSLSPPNMISSANVTDRPLTMVT
ncbi:hypothetical protein BGZ67_006138 [Mortierella alpina]|nr:hypothetical protein BGZ67_006138 [Mortierella alpina]